MIAIHALVGGVSGRDFPSPLRRLLVCLGITPHICPPHRPDKHAYELTAFLQPYMDWMDVDVHAVYALDYDTLIEELRQVIRSR